MKKTYRFEIQNCIKVDVKADNNEEARMDLINNLHKHADEMINDCVISDGEEVINK